MSGLKGRATQTLVAAAIAYLLFTASYTVFVLTTDQMDDIGEVIGLVASFAALSWVMPFPAIGSMPFAWAVVAALPAALFAAHKYAAGRARVALLAVIFIGWNFYGFYAVVEMLEHH